MIFYKNISKSSNFFLEVPTLADGRPRAGQGPAGGRPAAGRHPEGQNDKFENPDSNIYPSKNQSVFSNGEEVAQ